jgi:hypothetical protein
MRTQRSDKRERSPRLNGTNEQRTPAQLGVMPTVQRRTGGFTQTVELLVQRGLLSKFAMQNGYSLYQTIKADRWVVQPVKRWQQRIGHTKLPAFTQHIYTQRKSSGWRQRRK